jgi:hypothetical protein
MSKLWLVIDLSTLGTMRRKRKKEPSNDSKNHQLAMLEVEQLM